MRSDRHIDASDFPDEPLRDRMPRYLKNLVVLIVFSTVIGVVFGLVSDAGVVRAIGGTLAIVGMLVAGVGAFFGGGYDSLGRGTTGMLFGGRAPADPKRDATYFQDRLRDGLRPEANPSAFWSVVGGIGLVVAGLGILETFVN
jgi:hypothetical protein